MAFAVPTRKQKNGGHRDGHGQRALIFARRPGQNRAHVAGQWRLRGGLQPTPRSHPRPRTEGSSQPSVGNAARCWHDRASCSPNLRSAAHTRSPSPAHTGGPRTGPPAPGLLPGGLSAQRGRDAVTARGRLRPAAAPPRPPPESALRTRPTACSRVGGTTPGLGRPTTGQPHHQQMKRRTRGSGPAACSLARAPSPSQGCPCSDTKGRSSTGGRQTRAWLQEDSVSCPHPNWSMA